jgi:hypothetical protein
MQSAKFSKKKVPVSGYSTGASINTIICNYFIDNLILIKLQEIWNLAGKILQEPDEGKLSSPDLKTR